MLRAVYVDLDGTLLGPRGSLFRASDGGFSMEGARVLQACHRADVEVVIYTGRAERGVDELMRLLGQRSYIFELGCGIVIDGEREWLTGELVPSEEYGTIFQQIERTGAPKLLLDTFAGRLEYHTPWSIGREVSHVFRGHVDADEASAALEAAGLGWLRLVDNGVISGHGDTAPGPGWTIDVERVHCYHLIPGPASKARGVARHMQNRGFRPEECIACGDSREDMEAAQVVSTFWLMANAIEQDPTLTADIARYGNVRVTSAGHGAGVYEAVMTTLAELRA
ncbi:MAG TPA: HAD hydrolase family protein [Solirubrobacteraceae bacterium]|nr:HAD hydrolase family protein [Solirubrobacteraceae bacterium]